MTDDNSSVDQFAEELTLLLLYLASWTEGKGPAAPRAWKNHRFEILRALTAKGCLFDSKGTKSVYLTPEGVAAVKKLEEKYRRK